MVLAGRSIAVRAVFAASLAAGAIAARASADPVVEVYPGPGVDTHRSTLYSVEVFDGTNWLPSYVYRFSRTSATHWWTGSSPTVHFTTFGTTAPVQVRVTKFGGPITRVNVSPKSKPITGGIQNGAAIGTVSPGDKYWLTIEGDDANPLFVFADPLKPDVPAGATYFGPGIRDISPGTGDHYKATSGETIYLDGGAWVRGNIDVRGTTGVRVMGPGVLSGDLWSGEHQGSAVLPFDQFTNYAMITGDFFGGDDAEVDEITIVDSPGYNFFGGVDHVSGVKILSPWWYSTDAFQGVPHVTQSFVFNGDNIFMPGWAGLLGKDETFTHCFVATALNSVFSGGYWGNDPSHRSTALAEDIDVRTYNGDDWGPPLLASVFQVWMDNSDSAKGYRNQTYRNIRIEGKEFAAPLLELKNFVYPWGGPTAVNPPLGNSSNIVFQDISVTGTPNYRNEIKGWDAHNGFHDVVLDNFSVNGTVVDAANLHQYFDVNAFVWGLSFTAPESPCAPIRDGASSTASAGVRGPVIPAVPPCPGAPVLRPRDRVTP